MGKLVKVKITNAGKHHLMGVVSTHDVVEVHGQRSISSNKNSKQLTLPVNNLYSIDVLLIIVLLLALLLLSAYKFGLYQSFLQSLSNISYCSL